MWACVKMVDYTTLKCLELMAILSGVQRQPIAWLVIFDIANHPWWRAISRLKIHEDSTCAIPGMSLLSQLLPATRFWGCWKCWQKSFLPNRGVWLWKPTSGYIVMLPIELQFSGHLTSISNIARYVEKPSKMHHWEDPSLIIKIDSQLYKWRFPEMGVPLNHPFH